MKSSLCSERIHLRALELDSDSSYLHTWENDTTTWDSVGTLNPLSSNALRDYILHSATSIVERGEMTLMIQSATRPVGYVQIVDYDPISRRAGVGIYMSAEARNQGYGSEALTLLQEYAWDRLRCRMLFARVLSNNLPSHRLFSRLGYCHTATLPQWHWSDGAYHDLYYYQLWHHPS